MQFSNILLILGLAAMGTAAPADIEARTTAQKQVYSCANNGLGSLQCCATSSIRAAGLLVLAGGCDAPSDKKTCPTQGEQGFCCVISTLGLGVVCTDATKVKA